MILPFLTIASSSNRGRGVFTTEKIEKGTIIEIAPVIVLNPEERAHVEKTLLYDYIFIKSILKKIEIKILIYI
jgi:hypothetical protein